MVGKIPGMVISIRGMQSGWGPGREEKEAGIGGGGGVEVPCGEIGRSISIE